MKNLSLALNGVLIVAVIVLYVLFFNGRKNETISENTSVQIPVDNSGLGAIAFVELDTILSNYQMYNDLQADLLDKQKKSEAELNSKSQSWQKKATEYQNNLQKGLITRAQAAQVEAQLSQDQQGLLQLRDQMSMDLAEEKQVTDRKVMYSILEYLEEFNSDKRYKYILSKSFGGPVFFADSTYEITQQVLDGLNAKYSTNKDK
jgi:outer membrane protein